MKRLGNLISPGLTGRDWQALMFRAINPSNIDDPAIKSGFYGAPTVCAIFAPKNFLYSIPDAFCCAENMVLEATELGISSCIIARCFVLLGYCNGNYPLAKTRKEGRYRIIG